MAEAETFTVYRDINQSIFGWFGAVPNYIDSILKPKSRLVDVSYRWPSEISEVCLIAKLSFRNSKTSDWRANKQGGQLIRLSIDKIRTGDLDQIVRQCGYTLQILVRTKHYAEEYATQLREMAVRYTRGGTYYPKAAHEFRDKTTAHNQLWQTDFIYLKVIGWGWFYLNTILDDYCRYTITWKLCTNMAASDVQDALNQELEKIGLDQVNAVHRPRQLSNNGLCYISGDLADYLEDKGMSHTRGAPYHGQNRTLASDAQEPHPAGELLPAGDFEDHIAAFVGHYNHLRYHESLKNLAAADIYTSRGQTILLQREKKRRTMELSRLQHAKSLLS